MTIYDWFRTSVCKLRGYPPFRQSQHHFADIACDFLCFTHCKQSAFCILPCGGIEFCCSAQNFMYHEKQCPIHEFGLESEYLNERTRTWNWPNWRLKLRSCCPSDVDWTFKERTFKRGSNDQYIARIGQWSRLGLVKVRVVKHSMLCGQSTHMVCV